MRPRRCWTLLHVCVTAALLLSLNADNEECEVQVLRRRNAVYNVFQGDELRINCTVTFCTETAPTVSWFKIEENEKQSDEQSDVLIDVSSSSRFGEEWKRSEALKGVSFLIFKKTVTNDSGLYRCKSGESVGAHINVSVSDHDRPNSTTEQTLINTTRPNNGEDLMKYVYTAVGIVGFVVLVIVISVASMRGCKGAPKKGTREDNQCAVIPMAERPSQNPTPQPSPRGSPSVPLSRVSTRRKKPPPQPTRDNECVYSMLKDGTNQPRSTPQEEGSVVYAALNHQVPARAPARPRRPKEESSEYAAIRIKDPNFS